MRGEEYHDAGRALVVVGPLDCLLLALFVKSNHDAIFRYQSFSDKVSKRANSPGIHVRLKSAQFHGTGSTTSEKEARV